MLQEELAATSAHSFGIRAERRKLKTEFYIYNIKYTKAPLDNITRGVFCILYALLTELFSIRFADM